MTDSIVIESVLVAVARPQLKRLSPEKREMTLCRHS